MVVVGENALTLQALVTENAFTQQSGSQRECTDSDIAEWQLESMH